MNLQDWLNVKDYTTFQLTIALIGSVLWVAVYAFLIRDTIKKKYNEMPYFIACGNFAWEIQYAYFFDDYINLGEIYVWGYRAWFFLDILIFILIIKYAKKQVDNPWIIKNFTAINFSLLAFFSIFFYAWIKVGFDNTPIHGDGSVKLGATSAYMLNFGITILYITQFFKKKKTTQFSKAIAWCKGIGTGLFTILFWQVDPQNYLVKFLGILTAVGDSIYIALLYKYQQRKVNFNLTEFALQEKPEIKEW